MAVLTFQDYFFLQVALRYLLQRGLVVVPKSSSHDHLKENIDVRINRSKSATWVALENGALWQFPLIQL